MDNDSWGGVARPSPPSMLDAAVAEARLTFTLVEEGTLGGTTKLDEELEPDAAAAAADEELDGRDFVERKLSPPKPRLPSPPKPSEPEATVRLGGVQASKEEISVLIGDGPTTSDEEI